MSNEAVARVFRRLADRLLGVVADTSMMTISPEYAAHFLEVYVKKTDNAKFTGDRVGFLMLTLPFIVRDLIAPEVIRYSMYMTYKYCEWNVSVSDLRALHRKSVSLLELLKAHLPDRVGGAQGWNFEKAHSILHKVREIVMWGWSENTSCQGPEHAHIDIIKSVAHLTNNKDVFLCILRYHCRRGLLQQYEQLLEDMVGPGEARDLQLDRTRMAKALTGDRNFSISCELGVRYPTLRAMINREDLHLRKSVRSQMNGYAYEILSIPTIILEYVMYMLCVYYTYTD
jgi:hypothetical protein